MISYLGMNSVEELQGFIVVNGGITFLQAMVHAWF
jgi:hypothetical protein